MECMANSDNVIRAGLTPKLRDVPNLISTLTYTAAPWSKHRVAPSPFRSLSHSTLYDPPIPEFSVIQTSLAAGVKEKQPAVSGPSLAIVAEGQTRLTWEGGSLEVAEGLVVFIGAGVPVDVEAVESTVVLYRAFVEA
jgi:mannose-6-phosphate isomerase